MLPKSIRIFDYVKFFNDLINTISKKSNIIIFCFDSNHDFNQIFKSTEVH